MQGLIYAIWFTLQVSEAVEGSARQQQPRSQQHRRKPTPVLRQNLIYSNLAWVSLLFRPLEFVLVIRTLPYRF